MDRVAVVSRGLRVEGCDVRATVGEDCGYPLEASGDGPNVSYGETWSC